MRYAYFIIFPAYNHIYVLISVKSCDSVLRISLGRGPVTLPRDAKRLCLTSFGDRCLTRKYEGVLPMVQPRSATCHTLGTICDTSTLSHLDLPMFCIPRCEFPKLQPATCQGRLKGAERFTSTGFHDMHGLHCYMTKWKQIIKSCAVQAAPSNFLPHPRSLDLLVWLTNGLRTFGALQPPSDSFLWLQNARESFHICSWPRCRLSP